MKRKNKFWALWATALALYLMIVLSIGVIEGHYTYKYTLDKCNNMHTSSYDFNLDVQTNAEYAQNCYYAKNFRFAYAEEMAIDILCFLFIGFVIGVVPFALTGIKINDMYD